MVGGCWLWDDLHEQIVQEFKRRLHEEGVPFGLHGGVSTEAKPDGAWTQFYVQSDETRKNRTASRQTMADVEPDAIREAAREIILVPVFELLNAA